MLKLHNVQNNKVVKQHSHVITHGAFPMKFWAPTDVIKETFYMVLPYEDPTVYDVRITVLNEKTKRILSPDSLDTDLQSVLVGSLRILPSATYRIKDIPPLDHLKQKKNSQ